jgi:tetraacyldisaccharide 4'-kinase
MLNQILFWGQKRIEKGAWFFAPFSFLWGAISVLRNFLYDRKWLRITKVDCPVVSIGNIVAGGTGKTPLVILLASQFTDKRVAILSRGYKTADEPLIFSRRLKHTKIYVGKDRAKLAKQACQEGAELILLDDGFQHRKLHRDFDCVILHGRDPYGRGHFLPWGFLRDHPSRLKQADAIFINEAPFSTSYIHLKVDVDHITDLSGLKVAIFCGIAQPTLFKETVKKLGAKIVHEWILADHQKANKIEQFALVSKKKGASVILCTEKDFVKLSRNDYALPIQFIGISMTVTEGRSQWENLIAKIRQKIDNRAICMK